MDGGGKTSRLLRFKLDSLDINNSPKFDIKLPFDRIQYFH
jgi:hypothetical protein